MKLLIIILFCVIGFISYVRYLESTALFYPTKTIEATPSDWGMEYEDIFFRTEDGVKLNGWFIAGSRNKKTVLFIHGNAGNIGGRLDKINVFHRIGVNVFILDYRGYGKSEGSPTEKGCYADVRGAYDYLMREKKLKSEDIIVYGVSLGGSFAVDLATHRKISALIVDASFSSGLDMAKRMFPFVPSFMIKTQLDSAKKVRGLRIPKLFLHSQADEVVPYALGRKLFDAAADPKQFVELQGGHKDAHQIDRDKFEKTLKVFIEEN